MHNETERYRDTTDGLSVVSITFEFVASMISFSLNVFMTLLLVTKMYCSIIFSMFVCTVMRWVAGEVGSQQGYLHLICR